MDFLHEAGRALHRLARAPGYTAAAVVSLSLAIGANSAIFSAVHAVVLRPLPIREPDRLVTCWETNPQHNVAVVEVSYRNFRDWQAENRAFTGLAAMGASNWSMVLEGRGDPVRLAYTAVTASFFDVLGAVPAIGRTLPGRRRPTRHRAGRLVEPRRLATVLAATVGTRWLASLLFEVRPLDPGTYSVVVAVVLVATAVASLLPAFRASRLDPLTLLREA